ncbi:hypothetical protein D9V84_07100 [Bacteroidetes/Chlorobi group bacterium Naka2016]|jgi:hypothetical protein|nr:MAG: hypothetical protein D9V84_07100 [Bacteroidetes/Chlorobi group bacterium Naka2016]
MKSKALFEEMVEILKSIGYNVRKDNGSFTGGACIVKEQKLIVLNKNYPIEAYVDILASILYDYLDKIYIKPKVREFIESEGKKVSTPIEIIVNK